MFYLTKQRVYLTWKCRLFYS